MANQIQDKRRWWSREDVLLLLLLGALYFLPGLAQIPLFDRDEPRFATAARTMSQTGDYLVPMFNGALRPDKPPLIYWLMNAVYAATGAWNEFTVRLPSALCGALTLVVVYFMVGARFGRLTAMVAAMMLGSTVLFMFMAHMATADATMVFTITLCMACAWQAWDAGDARAAAATHLPRTDYLLDRSAEQTIVLDHLPKSARPSMHWTLAMLFWISLAAGILDKGVPLFFVFVPMVTLSLATGALPALLAQWRSHFRLTRNRFAVALVVAATAVALIIAAVSAALPLDVGPWAAILGILIMGMILTPGLPGVLVRCVAGGNWSWWRQLRPLAGVPLLLALTLWWFVVVGERTQGELLRQMIGEHFLNRVAGWLTRLLHIQIASVPAGAEGQTAKYGQPPGFYLALVWATFWPWSVLIVPAAFHAFRRMLGRTAIALDPRPYQFVVAWIVPMWVLLELSRGKLLHYPLPLYVGLAILCADALVQSWHRLTDVLAARWFLGMRWGMLLIWLGLAGALLWAAHRSGDPAIFRLCVPLAGALVAGGVAGAIAWDRPSWPFVNCLVWAGVLLYANAIVLPNLGALQAGRKAGQSMRDLKKAEPDFQLAAVGYQEASLVWYAEQNINMWSPTELLDHVTFAKESGESEPASAPSSVPASPASLASVKFLIAADPATVEVLRQHHLKFYVHRHYTGLSTGNFRKPVDITLLTNVLPTTESRFVMPTPATAP